jgi:AraC-like DNA-binding protein
MDLLASYRRLISDIESALAKPTSARQDRSTRRALAFMRDHLSEPLSLTRVARIAGFAPAYLSRLLKREEGATFVRCTRQLRVSRAKEMLADTELSVERIAQLSGFGTRAYFHRAFKHAVGVTPADYRRTERQ